MKEMFGMKFNFQLRHLLSAFKEGIKERIFVLKLIDFVFIVGNQLQN